MKTDAATRKVQRDTATYLKENHPHVTVRAMADNVLVLLDDLEKALSAIEAYMVGTIRIFDTPKFRDLISDEERELLEELRAAIKSYTDSQRSNS